MEESKGHGYLASSCQYGNALLGVRHQEEERHFFPPYPQSPPNFPIFPWEWVDGLWAMKTEGVGLTVVQLVSKICNLRNPDPPTSQTDRHTDRETDGRTDDMQSQYRAARTMVDN